MPVLMIAFMDLYVNNRVHRAVRTCSRQTALHICCRVDPERNLMWVEGSVGGAQGSWIMVRDARRMRKTELAQLPFPTVIGDPGEAKQAPPKKNVYDKFKS